MTKRRYRFPSVPLSIERGGRPSYRLSESAVRGGRHTPCEPLPAEVYQAALAECRAELAREGKSAMPHDISHGSCHLFAYAVERLLPGAEVAVGYGHHWVLWRDCHYDAESPKGVGYPKDLPYYRETGGDPFRDVFEEN